MFFLRNVFRVVKVVLVFLYDLKRIDFCSFISSQYFMLLIFYPIFIQFYSILFIFEFFWHVILLSSFANPVCENITNF